MSLVVPLEEIFANKTKLLANHESWKRINLGEACTILNGFPFKSTLFNNSEGFPIIRIRDIARSSTQTFYSGDFPPEYIVKKGDLLIGMDGNFRCCEWLGRDAGLNQRVCKITPDERILHRKFLFYGLNGYLTAIENVTSSVTVGHLSSRDVQRIPFLLPPLAEQQRTHRAAPTGLCRMTACVTFPSLLWSPSAHAISLTPPADGFHLMVHPSILEAFVTGLRTRLTGRVPLELASCGSLSRGSDVRLFATACTVARAAGQPPPEARLRRASPDTAELAPVEVSLVRRPPSLRGLTISYRGGTFTRWLAKDRRLHSPVRDERKPSDIPHDRILRNHEIKSVAFFRPSGAWWCWPLRPTVETLGYCRSSLAGLQNGLRRVESLFAQIDQLEAPLAAAQRHVDVLAPSLLARAFAGKLVPQNPNDEPASALLERIKTHHESKSHRDDRQ